MVIKENFKDPETGNKVRMKVSFDSYGEYLDWIQKNKHLHDRAERSISFSSSETHSVAHALDLAHNGWKEGLEKASQLISNIEERLFSNLKVKRMEYLYAGGGVDVGVFMSNDPECFVGWREEEVRGQGKLATIVVNSAASAHFSSADIMARGVAIVATVDAMEKQGRSCEIIWRMTCSEGGYWDIEVPIKKQGEHIEMERVAFALAHPSSLRRLGVAAMDIMKVPLNCGTPQECLDNKGDLYFGRMLRGECPSGPDEMVQWILKMLASQGIELEDN